VDRTARVAGRPAYQLVLTPRDGRTLIASVRIALDSATSVPLRVQVYARGQSAPAVEIGFTDVSFRVPASSVFRFTLPAGARVTERAVTPDDVAGSSDAVRPTVIGRGWTAVLETRTRLATDASGRQVLDRLSTPVAGGRLVTTRLVSVLLTDDGRVLAGAVAPDALRRVAATGKPL
ncbi:MAG TPA: hypothetical protein VKP11_11115, partial [Frankiaceae bacterium]|nr:hypothetical protein [Frankiaceae bacterium]